MRYNATFSPRPVRSRPRVSGRLAILKTPCARSDPCRDDEPFKPGGSFGNTHLLMLIAAYGGLPVDYRTTPPTLNFTDPATVDAIRQVLDLARNGTMDYSALVSAGGGFVVAVGEGGTSTPLYTQTLNGLGGLGGVIAFGGGSGEIIVPQNADPIVLFPGAAATPVSYAISAAYISARSPTRMPATVSSARSPSRPA